MGHIKSRIQPVIIDTGMERRLTEARIAAGLTQTAVADRLGISQQAVTSYERNFTAPTPERLEELAAMYHVTVDWLKYGTGWADCWTSGPVTEVRVQHVDGQRLSTQKKAADAIREAADKLTPDDWGILVQTVAALRIHRSDAGAVRDAKIAADGGKVANKKVRRKSRAKSARAQ